MTGQIEQMQTEQPQAEQAQTEQPAQTAPAHDEFQAARIVHIRIQPDRAIVDVQVSPRAPARTTPELAQRAAELRPDLPQHTCVNAPSRAGQARPLFSSVMDDTPLPHLLEHLVIDVLTQKWNEEVAHAAAAAPTFVGTSEWLDRSTRTARIELSCPDDLLVLSAFREALHLLNLVVVG